MFKEFIEMRKKAIEEIRLKSPIIILDIENTDLEGDEIFDLPSSYTTDKDCVYYIPMSIYGINDKGEANCVKLGEDFGEKCIQPLEEIPDYSLFQIYEIIKTQTNANIF